MIEKGKAEILVSGMHCAGCAKTLERSFAETDGVKNAEVTISNEMAVVEFDPSKLSFRDLEKVISKAGYSVVSEETDISVGGMSCAGCVSTIEKALKSTDGVHEVEVSLNAQKAHVIYNPRVIDLSALKQAIESAGYQYLGKTGDAGEIERKSRERELESRKRRAIAGFIIGIPLMIIGFTGLMMNPLIAYIELLIATPAFIYVGGPILISGARALRNRSLTMDVMYSMGISVSFISSLLATFNLLLTREFLFYDTAVLLATFLMLGKYLEARAKGKTGDAIRKLMDLKPHEAIVLHEDRELVVPVDEITINDIVVVKPGARNPVDGTVIEGSSYVDESMITGEPMPVLKKKGDGVVGGTINKNGVLHFKATKVGKDMFLAQVIKLVRDAQGSKPPIQKIADGAVSYFIPVLLVIAIIASLSWYLIAHSTLHFALTVLISILVIACPCALGLATPAAVTVGIGRGAEMGILIKSSEVLELSEKLDTVLLDKTGTVTKGLPEVTDIFCYGIDETELLSQSAAIEKNSQHPLAESIVRKAKALSIPASESFESFDGKGVRGSVSGHLVTLGKPSFLEEHHIIIQGDYSERISALEDQGKTVVVTAIDGEVRGIMAISDEIKESAFDAVQMMRRMKLDVAIVTGDNERSARAVAKELGISEVYAGLLPREKGDVIKNLRKDGKVVAFVGDGINDAPALALSDVGIALGSGTDVAIESGEVVLISDNLIDAAKAVLLSRKVMERIKQNLFWAFAYNVILIPVAAGLLYPHFGLMLKPELAGLAMALSSVTVLLLSLSLRRYNPGNQKSLHKE